MHTFDTAFFSTVPAYSVDTNSVSSDIGAMLLDSPNMEVEEQKKILDLISCDLGQKQLTQVSVVKDSLDNLLARHMHEYAYAFSAFFFLPDALFLYTSGQGAVFIHRIGQTKTIIEGKSYAVGKVRPDDIIILTTKSCQNGLLGLEDVSLFQAGSAQGIIGQLSRQEHMVGDLVIFLIGHVTAAPIQKERVEAPVVVQQQPELLKKDNGPKEASYQDKSVEEEELIEQDELAPFVDGSLETKQWVRFMAITRDKKLMIGVVIVLLTIIGWSIFSGNRRRKERIVSEKAAATATIVDQKLSDAKEIAPLELSQALASLDSARKQVQNLHEFAVKQKVEDPKEVSVLQTKIDAAEKSFKKQDEITATEYYDLDLIDKDASAGQMSVEDDMVALLDADRGYVYIVAGEKKAATQYKDVAIKGSSAVFIFNEKPYVLHPDNGVYVFEEETKPTLSIKEEQWGTVKDITVFNGNVYIFDRTKPDVYKYLVAEEGFSSKRSYFKEGEVPKAFSDGTSMMIDGSLYIATPTRVLRYLSGGANPITLSPPEEMKIDDIYTASDVDDIYILDKSHDKIFIFSKDGTYKKQITSSVISETDDFGVLSDKTILVLQSNKVYKL